ncbi:MAG: hypothetical protein GXX79_14900 [Actinomycetales bacterium]|nr:hypothetical protein [Actinomycetales bacterium]
MRRPVAGIEEEPVAAGRITMIRPSRATRLRRSRTRRPRSSPAEVPPATVPASKPARAQVFEDHDLTSDQRATWWADLVDWVAWLHDAYELSTDHRLPECWHQHPGLVQELTALRAWRAEIYTPPTDPDGHPAPVWGNGGSARAWHGELRNVLRAATTDYAVRCRAGHKPPTPLTSGDEDPHQEWAQAIPEPLRSPAGTPAPPEPASHGGGLRVSHQHMRALLAAGQAQALCPHIPGYVHHDGTWWVAGPEQTWLAVTDPALAEHLDAAAATWARAQAATAAYTPSPHQTHHH